MTVSSYRAAFPCHDFCLENSAFFLTASPAHSLRVQPKMTSDQNHFFFDRKVPIGELLVNRLSCLLSFLWALILASSAAAGRTAIAEEAISVTENDQTIQIETSALKGTIRKQGYVMGVAAQSFVDKKSGLKDAGFGLDIVDWIMEPGSDEAYRDKLTPEMVYQFGNNFHGKTPKRSIEGPQICTQAKQLAPVAVKGKDFVAI